MVSKEEVLVKARAVCMLSMHFSKSLYVSDLFLCSQVLDYWTVEVSTSYVSTGMGNLPEGEKVSLVLFMEFS